jgi:hypothetical protein
LLDDLSEAGATLVLAQTRASVRELMRRAGSDLTPLRSRCRSGMDDEP